MDKQLIEDSFRMLQTDMSPVAGIQLHLSPVDQEHLLQLLSVLESHDLEYNRKVHLLGIYIILTTAATRHMECVPHHPDLTRNLLDGDYLYSYYLDFAIKVREFDLVAHLASFIKKLQIRRANGDFAEVNLAAEMEQFLVAERRQHNRTYTAI